MTKARLIPPPLSEITEVRPTADPSSGLGLFAKVRIPKGMVWWRATADNVWRMSRAQYEVLNASELEKSPASRELLRSIHRYGYIHHAADEMVVALDNSRFVNHSDTPTSGEDPDDPTDHAIALVDIEPGDELTEDYRDYGEDDWGILDEDFMGPWAARKPSDV